MMDLPYEVLQCIFSSALLSQSDRKALRLTCKTIEPAARAALFHRIALSCVAHDRDAFFHIAATPRLAKCVREVAWFVLKCNALFAVSTIFYTLLDEAEELADYDTVSQLSAWSRNKICWIEASVPWYSASRQATLADFEHKLAEAVPRLTGLGSIVYQNMPVERVVARLPPCAGPYCGWPITAGSLQAHSFLGEDELLNNVADSIFARTLLPYVSSRSANNIVFIDGCQPIPLFHYIRESSSASRLTSVALTLDARGETLLLELAGNFLRQAHALRDLDITLTRLIDPKPWEQKWWRSIDFHYDLHVCVDDSEDANSAVEAARKLLGHAYCEGTAPAWPRLTSLSLTEVQMKEEDLLALIRRHATSLRRLTLGEYGMHECTLRKMANIPNLSLTSIQLFCEGVQPEYTELFLLRYLTHQFDPDICDFGNFRGPVTTHISVYSNSHGVTPHRDAVRGYSHNGTPVKRKNETLWYLDDFTGKRIYYCNEDDDNSEDNIDSAVGDTSDTESIDSQDARLSAAPRWKYGRFFSSTRTGARLGTIYCWPVPEDERGGYLTQAWAFSHHSGELACGTEPLSFFEDWNSEIDVATPLPHCDNLNRFHSTSEEDQCYRCHSSREHCVEEILGSTTELLWRIPLPKDAIPWFSLEQKEKRSVEDIAAEFIRFRSTQTYGPQSQRTQPNNDLQLGAPVVNTILLSQNSRLLDLGSLRPWWKWGLFIEIDLWENQDYTGACRMRACDIYYWQVPSDERGASPTAVWRFVKGHNISYGRQPDAGEGTVEATPFSAALHDFFTGNQKYCKYNCHCLFDVLGYTTNLLPLIKPPEGAIKYCCRDDPFGSKRVIWVDGRETN